MVEVRYLGRLGNRMFQYCFGRILAEGLGFKLKADPIPGFPCTKESVEGKDFSQGYPVQYILHDYPPGGACDYNKALSWKNNNLNMNSVINDHSERYIVVQGFFQRYIYYKNYKDVIRNVWMRTDIQVDEDIGKDDIVLHIRRGDYCRTVEKYYLPFSFYKQVLDMANYNRIFICTDDPNDSFIKMMKKRYNAKIGSSNSPVKDLVFISKFNKIVQSPSSFCWWASFLSDAKEIYTPVPATGLWGPMHPEIDLKIDDDSRYIYVASGKDSLQEHLLYLSRRFRLFMKTIKYRLYLWIHTKK